MDEQNNNPTPEQVEIQAESLTGDALLKKIKACRDETKDILTRVPYKMKEGSFNGVMNQIENDQNICLKYIELLDKNIKNLKKSEVGNLEGALLATKNRLVGEKKMVITLRDENPYSNKNLTPQEVQSKKIEELYTINAFLGFAKGQEDIEWANYETFSQEQQLKQAQGGEVEKSTENPFNPFSVIIIMFLLFVLFKRSEWGKSLVAKAVNLTTTETKKEDKKD